MNRSNPAQIRKSLELANQLKIVGIEFIPIPVLNDNDRVQLLSQLNEKLDVIEKAAHNKALNSDAAKSRRAG